MKWLRRILCVLVMLVVSNLVAVVCVLPLYRRTGEWRLPLAACLLVLLLILILVRPLGNAALPTRRIRQLAAGAELLRLFRRLPEEGREGCLALLRSLTGRRRPGQKP